MLESVVFNQYPKKYAKGGGGQMKGGIFKDLSLLAGVVGTIKGFIAVSLSAEMKK